MNSDITKVRSRFLDRSTPPHLLTLVLIAGIGALNMNIILPSLPAMASYFSTDYAIMQLAISAYLAMTAALQLITGPLSDRYGRRPVLLGSFVIFILATIVAAVSTSIEVFLAARLVQAAIVTGYTLSRAIIRDMVPMEQAASMIGYVTMGMTIVPMIGPALGGLLEESFGWQASFWLTTAMAILVLVIVFLDLKETNSNKSASITAQFAAYPELFASKRFWGFVITAMFASGTFFAFLGGAPYVASNHLGLSPSSQGLYFVFLAVGYMTGNFISGRFATTIGVYKMMLLGNIVASAGIVCSALFFLLGNAHAAGFFGPLFFLGAGNGLTLPSANAGIVSVRPHLAGSAAGIGGAIQIGGGAALSVFAGLLLTPDSGPLPLLWLMLLSGCLAIVSSLYTTSIAKKLAKTVA